MRVPGLRDVFASNSRNRDETDIVMLLTPHIVRTHELTAEDLAPIYIGTQQRVGLTGAPQLIAPPEGVAEPPRGAEPAVGRSQPGAEPGVPAGPQAGAAAPGVQQPVRPTVPPGTSPIPGQLPPPQPAAPAATTTPPPVAPLPEPTAPTAEPAEPGAPPPAAAPQAAAQLIVTPPGTEFRVGGGPYTVPVSINGVSRLSTVTLTLTFEPTVLRARSVQEGSFMRQGSATPTFTPRIDAGAGRVDVAISRTNDATGASGSGLLAAVLFDAIAAGNVTFTVNGTGTTPEGTVIPITSAPVTVTVR
jgi:general secretion pathway protein D